MPLAKEQVEAAFEPVVRSLLEPGERVLSAAYVVPGPSPRAVGFLGAAVQAMRGRGDLWMAVTDRRVVFVGAGFMSQKPKGLAWSDPRHAVSIADVHGQERSGWNWFVYLRPDGEPVRVNVSVIWEQEMTGVLDALSEPPPAPHPQGWAE